MRWEMRLSLASLRRVISRLRLSSASSMFWVSRTLVRFSRRSSFLTWDGGRRCLNWEYLGPLNFLFVLFVMFQNQQLR